MATKKIVTKKVSEKKTLKKTADSSKPKKVAAKKTKTKITVDLIEQASEAAKIKATKDGIPYVQVLGIDLDPANPTFGAFTLDWNALFVKQLKSMGYVGDTDEKIVDQWFKTLSRNVYMESFENSQAQVPGNGRRPQRTPLTDGRVVVS